MTKRILFSVLSLLLLAGPVTGQPDPDQVLPVDPNIITGTLDNGLTYYIRENHKPESRAELRLAVNAGSLLEEDDQQGLAHFLEHMAFNGTEHFKANELVSYLESIGSRFGADLNAYTSFDETVYMLEIPTDKEGLLEKGVLVLSDWAHTITLDPEEVEKERGVVLEEWRRGRGAQERLRRKHWPVLLEGSRYAERLPIGTPEVIETAPVERLQHYYTTWYRPSLMAVVAVGSFDAADMEALIRENFSGLSEPENPVERTVYSTPSHPEPRASAATDPEMAYTQVAVYFKHPTLPEGTLGSYRRNMTYALLSGMLNARLAEITEQPEAPFKYAGSGAGSSFRGVDMFQAFAVTDEGKATEALSAVLTELRRMAAHGFSEGELERAKADRMAAMERFYNEREKTESPAYAGEYVRNFLEKEPIPGIEAEFALTQELLPAISLDDLNAAVERLVHENDMVILASEPEKDGLTPVESGALLTVAQEVSATDPEPYQDTVQAGDLIPVPPTPGEVVTRRDEEALGATVLSLSNGVEVWIKPTPFKNDEVIFGAVSQGGTSLASEDDFPSASLAMSLVGEAGLGTFTVSDLEKKLSGKIASASPYASLFAHGVRGGGTPKDLETALQLVHLYFTSPNTRPEAFDVLLGRYRTFIQNRLARPETRYADQVMLTNYDNHPLFQPPDADFLDRMNRERAMEFYRGLLADASDFRFFFVGAIDVEAAIPLLCRYLGSLPTDPGTDASYRDIQLSFPKGIIEKTVYAGTEPKSQTLITWPALTGLDEFEMFYLRKANDILEIRLRDVLREELGGTYSVSVGYSAMHPYPEYGTTTVSYGSSPENAEKLAKAVMDVVSRFKEEGPTDDEVNKIIELELRSLETGLEQNGFWLASFTTLDLLGWDPNRILSRRERAESVTAKKLHDLMQRYYPPDNFTRITLQPEEAGGAGDGSR